MRDYGVDEQIGLEQSLEEYHERLLEVTAECMRVLKPSGVMFWNHGDSYGGSGNASGHTETTMNCGKPTVEYGATKGHTIGYMPKCMLMQNERLIMRMIDDQGWILRNRIVWNKNNGMPSSVQDRFTNKYEPVYMLVKQKKYWFDMDSVRVPHKNATEVKYRRDLRANKKYDVKAPYKANTPYQHNTARERFVSDGKNPGDVCEMTQDVWMNYCHDLWDMYAGESGDILRIPTKPYAGAHFATFPTTLIEPLVKVACPAEICPKCGHIRERITKKKVEFVSGSGKAGNVPKGKYEGHEQAKSGTYDVRMGPQVTYHTTGWTSCDCNAGWIAGTVFDPFAGSGTVLEVCRRLSRNAIGFELNPEYEKLILERSMSHTPPLTSYFGGDE